MQRSASRVVSPAKMTPAEGSAASSAAPAPRTTPERMSRADADREWHEAVQGRCVPVSPFAVPAAGMPAC